MMMHPYHNYAVLFDKDFHKMIEQALKSNLCTNVAAYNKAKAEMEVLVRNNKATEFDLVKLRVAENLFSESQHTLNLWHSKQVARITEEQKEALFDNKTVS
jgi:hypothetical protein